MDYNIFPVLISTHFKKIQRKKSQQATCRRYFYYLQRCSFFSENIRNTWSYVQHSPKYLVLRTVYSEIPGPTYSIFRNTWSYVQHIPKYQVLRTAYSQIPGPTYSIFRNTWSYVQHIPMSAMVLRWILHDLYYLHGLQNCQWIWNWQKVSKWNFVFCQKQA